MRHPLFLLLVLIAAPAFYSLQAAEIAPEQVADLPWWGTLLVLVVTTVSGFVANWLKNKATAESAIAEDASMSAKERALVLLKNHAIERAANIAEKEFPLLAQKVLNGDFDDEGAIKAYMKGWGVKLKDELKVLLAADATIAAAGAVTDETLDSIIEWAANKVSPFPGKDTALTLLDKGADKLVKYGIEKARDYIDDKDE